MVHKTEHLSFWPDPDPTLFDAHRTQIAFRFVNPAVAEAATLPPPPTRSRKRQQSPSKEQPYLLPELPEPVSERFRQSKKAEIHFDQEPSLLSHLHKDRKKRHRLTYLQLEAALREVFSDLIVLPEVAAILIAGCRILVMDQMYGDNIAVTKQTDGSFTFEPLYQSISNYREEYAFRVVLFLVVGMGDKHDVTGASENVGFPLTLLNLIGDGLSITIEPRESYHVPNNTEKNHRKNLLVEQHGLGLVHINEDQQVSFLAHEYWPTVGLQEVVQEEEIHAFLHPTSDAIDHEEPPENWDTLTEPPPWLSEEVEDIYYEDQYLSETQPLTETQKALLLIDLLCLPIERDDVTYTVVEADRTRDQVWFTVFINPTRGSERLPHIERPVSPEIAEQVRSYFDKRNSFTFTAESVLPQLAQMPV